MTAAPPAEELDRIRLAAEQIAQAGGAMLQEMYAAPLDVRYKARRKDRDPVTAADEAVEAFVRRSVAERFPTHGVLGEEADDTAADAEFLWVVDPLDGTANFASGLPLFACSIGVLRERRPVVAALYVTFGPLGTPGVLSARAGGGLLIDGEPFMPRPRAVLKRARAVGVPAGFHRRFRVGRLGAMPPGETRSLGSIAVELGLAATGTLQYAVFGGPKIWDVAAGVVLCQESGRIVLIREGRRWRQLERFETRAGKPLREWSLPLLAGEQDSLRGFVPRLGVRRHPLELAEKLIGPRRAKRLKEAIERASDRLPERWRR